MFTLQVNAKYIKALQHCMAKEDIRYYLCGVHIKATAAGKFYTATDGHRLAVFHDAWRDGETPCECECIIPDNIVKAIKPRGNNDAVLTIEPTGTPDVTFGNEHATLSALDGPDMSFTCVNGKFPDWSRILPKETSGAAGSYNWRYLADFDRIAKQAYGAKFPCDLYQNGPKTAAIVMNGCQDFIGLVMPVRMRNMSKPLELPAWLA